MAQARLLEESRQKGFLMSLSGEKKSYQTILGALNAEIYERMNGVLEKAGLLLLKGGNPTQEVNTACCDSFANYIYKMINQ